MAEYAAHDETRREHLAELIATFDWRTFGLREHREVSAWLLTLARGMDRGLALVRALLEELRQRHILAPAMSVIDRLASAVRIAPAVRRPGVDRRSQPRAAQSGWMNCWPRTPTPGRRISAGLR